MAKKSKTPTPAVEETGWDDEETTPVVADESADDWDNEDAEAEEPTSDDWDSVPAVPALVLNIEKHQGVFDTKTTKIMVYGESGSGKSRFASTMPNVIFADIDHGLSSVDRHIDKVTIDDSDLGFKQLETMYKFLAEGDHEYETVVLDTLNEMQRVIMRFTLEEFTTIRRSYGSLPGMSDYGFMLNQFMELTQKFISLPMRVVLLAQVNSQQFDTDILMPQLIGKNSARDLSRKMDVIGHIFKSQEGDRVVHTISFDDTQHVTKDRSNKLPTVLPDATYDRMSAFWK